MSKFNDDGDDSSCDVGRMSLPLLLTLLMPLVLVLILVLQFWNEKDETRPTFSRAARRSTLVTKERSMVMVVL